MQRQHGRVAGVAAAQCRQLHQQMPQRPGHHAPGQPDGRIQRVALPGRRADDAPNDDAHVVDRRRDRGQQEMLAGVERGHDDAADAEDDRREQHDAHQIDRERQQRRLQGDVLGVEKGDERRGEDHHQHRDDRRDDGDEVGDGREEPPAASLVVAAEIGGERWYKSRADGAAGDDQEDGLRKAAGNVERGCFQRRDAQILPDDDLARQAKYAAEKGQRGHQPRGAKHLGAP